METVTLLFLHENPEEHRVRYCDCGYTTSKLRSRTSNAGLLALHLAFNTYCLPNAFHQLFAERKQGTALVSNWYESTHSFIH